MAAAFGLLSASARAATYTWSSPTLGGSWSTAGNWNPATAPIAGDVAILDTVSGTTLRTVIYDTAASGAFSTLTLNQTSSGTNTLDVQRNLTVSNTITLGASGGGLVRLLVSPTSGTSTTSGTLSASMVINAGGMLSLMAYNPNGSASFGGGNVIGNVTLQGGQIVADTSKNGTGGSVTTSISGTLTMTSGTLTIVNGTSTGTADRRIQVNALNVSGGDVLTTATNGSLATIAINNPNTTNTFNPTNFSSSAVQISLLGGSGTTSLTSNQIVNYVARGNGVKTFTSSLTGTNFGSLSIVDGDLSGTANTFRLGSNLTLASGRNLPNSTAPSILGAQRFDVGIDVGTYTLDLTATNAVFTPNTPYGSGTAVTYWTFSGSGGRIIANGFNLTGTAGVATSVGPGVILESRSGNSGTNSLSLGSGSGTLLIDPTSIFRYSGTASTSTPATLTSSRAIGDLEVTSGALSVLSLAGQQNIRVQGGTLLVSNTSFGAGVLSSGSFSVSSGAVLAVANSVDDATVQGALTTGTFAAAGLFGFDTASGNRTYANAITGGMGIAKVNANTLTLSTANSYTGGTLINGGVLAVADPGALGSSGSIRFGGGTLQYSASNTVDYSSRILGSSSAVQVDLNGQNVTFASPIVTSNTGGFTRTGGGLLTLSGTGSYTTSMTLNGGTTVIDPGAGNAASFGAIKVMSNASGAAVATIASGSVTFAPVGNYFAVGDGNAGSSGTVNVTGGSTTIDLTGASSRMIIGNKVSGAMNVTGGRVTVAGGNSIYVGGDSQYVVSSATGTLTISGGTMAVTSAGSFILGNSGTNGNANTGVVGILNLNGGELQTIRAITTGTSGTATNAQSGYVNFNGGVLKPLTSSTGFMQGLTGAYVQFGGAIIDTNGFDITIAQPLWTGSGGSTGGLTKSGAGTLTLTGTSSYAGATMVSAGTLALSGGSGRLPSLTTLAFTGGTVAVTGASQVNQTVATLTVADSTSAALVNSSSNHTTFTVTSAMSLGGGSGTSSLLLQPTTAYNVTVSASNGVAINAGGDLRLGGVITGSNSYTGGIFAGPVTVNGGSLTIAALTGTAAGYANTSAVGVNWVGPFTMTAGRLFIDNSGTNADRRLGLNGNVAITGGTIAQTVATYNGNGLQLSGSNTGMNQSLPVGVYTYNVSPASYDRYIGMSVFATGTTTVTLGMASSQVPYQLMYRNWGLQVLSSTAAGNPIANLLISDANSTTPGQGNTVQLASNLTLVSTGALPAQTNYSVSLESGRADVGIDVNGYTFDMTANSGTWRPNASPSTGTSAQTYWQLSSSSGTGRFVANGFNFVYSATASGLVSNAYTSVGANVILESKSGDGAANNLGSGSINAASVFRYSGTASGANPATLTAAAAIGDLEVTSAGALKVLSLGGVQAVRVSSGILDLGNNLLTVTSGSFGGGTVQSGTLSTAGIFTASDGTISASLAGAGSFTKISSGTVTLAGANTYAGTTNVNAGQLVVNGSLAGDVATLAGGILGGSGSVGAISGAGLVGPGNSPGILTATSVDPSGGMSFAFEFTQAAPDYASASNSGNDLLWLTGVSPFASSLSTANAVNIYFTQAAVELGTLTGGFFTANTGDFVANISGATFQYYVQDTNGSTIYNGNAYKSLAEYDSSKYVTISTVLAANGGQVMQMVVIPEPGAFVLAGIGVAAAWACRRRAAR